MKLLRFVAIIAVNLLVTLGLLEIGTRWLNPQELTYDGGTRYEVHGELGWRLKPDLRVPMWREGRKLLFCTGADGDRISCTQAADRACEQTILVLGDSFVEATALSYEETIWHHIERDTNACLEVTGVGGYGIGQYHKVLQRRLAREAGPRYALILLNVFTGNDFEPEAWRVPEANQVWQRRFRLLPEELSLHGIFLWLYPLNQRLESVSHAWVAFRNVVRNRLFGGSIHVALRPSLFSDRLVDDTFEAIRRLVVDADRAGIPLHLTLIPIQNQVLDPEGVDLARQVPSAQGDIDMDLPSIKLMPRVRELIGDRSLDLLEPLRARAERDSWGRLDAHFSPIGHRLWFELAREDLRALLRLDP